MKLTDLLPKVAKLKVLHPISKEPLGLTLHVVGHDSKQFRDTYREILKSTQGKKEADLLELEKSNLRLVAACIVGWDAEAEEAFGPFSTARALEIVAMDELSFIKEQVEAFISERSNFFRTDSEGA